MTDRVSIPTPPSATQGSACPGLAQLTSFCAGKVGDAEFDSIAAHLDSCAVCGGWVESHVGDDTVAYMLSKPNPLTSDRLASSVETGRLGLQSEARSGPAIADERASNAAAARGPSSHGQLQQTAAGSIPHKLAHYRIIELLGAGGMGEVYKALDEKLQCPVAIKILHLHRVRDERIRARFDQEMRAVGSLDHLNIVRARTAGEQGDLHYLVMDYVDGADLKQLLKRAGRFGVREACEVATQAAAGLQRIFEHGLVHRDIKPSNLMVDARGVVKILDLGLAQWQREDEDSLTTSRDLMGTIDYMAPEQASDPRSADIRADVYSLGCTLFELLTGQAPFSGKGFSTLREKLQAHHSQEPPSVKALTPAVPDALDAIVRRALAKHPQDRFATPMELRDALAPFTNTGAALTGLLALSPTVRPSPVSIGRTGRRRWMLGALLGTAAVVAGAVGWLRDLFRKPAPTPQVPDWYQQLSIETLPGATTESRKNWDEQAKIAVISTSDWCFVRAGSVDVQPYTLSIEFQMLLRDGQCGLYVGHGERNIDGQMCSVFQFLDFFEQAPDQWRLRRRMAFLPPSATVPATLVAGAGGTTYRQTVVSISSPLANQVNRIEVRVDRTGLVQLTWNGEPVASLASIETNRQYQQNDYVGPWGFAVSSTVWIKSMKSGN